MVIYKVILFWLIIVSGLYLIFGSAPTVSYKPYSTNTAVITKEFGDNKYVFKPLVDRIKSLAPGEPFTIVLMNHPGGVSDTRVYITNAIRASKGVITIKLIGENWSNAALMFRHGNYAIVPYKSVTVYHQAFEVNIWGRTSYPMYLYKWSLREHLLVNAFEFMTKGQVDAWNNREDVYVAGYTICKSRFVIKREAGYCIISGIKD